MFYPNLKNEEQTLLKITTKHDDFKVIKYKRVKDDHENFLKNFRLYNDYYKKIKV